LWGVALLLFLRFTQNEILFVLSYVEIGNKRIQEAQKLMKMPDGILLEKENLF